MRALVRMAKPFRCPGTLLLASLLLAALLSACSGLAFVKDTQLSIVYPRNYSTVNLPVTIRWVDHGAPAQSPLAVFVDHVPNPPRQSVRYLAQQDPACLSTPGCPNKTWLVQHGVHLIPPGTKSLTLPYMSNNGNPNVRDLHRITIVMFNSARQRVTEASFSVEFFVNRKVP